MGEQHEHKVDKSKWADGPWMSEPDKLNWRTAVGLPGMIVRGPHGALCGYVAVPEGHPCFGRDFSSEYERNADGEPDYSRPVANPVHDLECHGGITYGDACAGVICHVPEPGEPDNVWWLGFDCAHSGDIAPAADWREHSSWEAYRDIGYVRREVERLAKQLAAMK